MRSVLFVCLGNICRSPSAEAVMRRIAPEWEIDSAGTGAWHIGNPPDDRAIAEGARRGCDLTPLRARQLSKMDFEYYDLIVAMDAQNERNIKSIQPRDDTTPVIRLLGDRDVPDPYYDGSFDLMYDLIENGCRKLLEFRASE